jgi:hypothetical protein
VGVVFEAWAWFREGRGSGCTRVYVFTRIYGYAVVFVIVVVPVVFFVFNVFELIIEM